MKKIIMLLISFLLLTGLKQYEKNRFPLLGKCIYIDVGHGGADPGTVVVGIQEKDLNLSVSLQLKEELEKSGATVLIIRDGDYDLASPNATRRKKSDFDNRIERINQSTADLYISIHMNYLEESQYDGPQVFYETEASRSLAQTLQEALNELGSSREIKEMPDIYMYKRLMKKGVLIECGFLSNKEERRKLQTAEYQLELAQKIKEGLILYFT